MGLRVLLWHVVFVQVGPTELLAVEDELKHKLVETGLCREVLYSH